MAISRGEIVKLLSSGVLFSDPRLVAPLDAAEKELVAVLKAKDMGSAINLQDSEMLRRFLVARNIDIEPTVLMLEEHAAWRKETLPIALTDNIVAELKKGKAYHHGFDAVGRPLLVIRSRCFDPKERNLEDAIKAVFYQMEEAISVMPRGQTQFTIFYDRYNVSSKNTDIALMKGVIKTLGDNYPEMPRPFAECRVTGSATPARDRRATKRVWADCTCTPRGGWPGGSGSC